MPSSAPSLESLCAAFSFAISRQAVDKRFTKRSVAFLKACLELLLQKITSLKKADNPSFVFFRRVLVADSTQWPINKALKRWFRGFGGGASKAACKLQTVIEAASGKILLFDYHRATLPDQGYSRKLLRFLRPSDLILFDLGYYSVRVFKTIAKLNAFFISPIYYHATVKKQSRKDSSSIAAFLQKSRTRLIDSELVVGSKESMALRVVALRNSAKKAGQLRRKLRKDCRRQRRGQPTKERLQFCDWTTLITNIPTSQMSAQNIIDAYRTRWQIEIFFRDAKSQLRLNASSTTKRERFEVQLLAVLFVAALLFFIQGRFNVHRPDGPELSLEKLIKRYAQYASELYQRLINQTFDMLGTFLEKLLRNSIKFHQPSRQTPRQIMKKCCLS